SRRRDQRVLVTVQKQQRNVEQVLQWQSLPTGRIHSRAHLRRDRRPSVGPQCAKVQGCTSTVAEARKVDPVGVNVVRTQNFQKQIVHHRRRLLFPPHRASRVRI